MLNNSINKYKKFYKYTDTSLAIQNAAQEISTNLGKNPDTRDAAFAVCEFINARGRDRSVTPSKPKRVAKTLLESRFTKASDMVEVPISSCGANATLAASILRQMGFAVRLIHGDKPNSDQHAWNEIWNKKEELWQAFDCSAGSGNGFKVSADSIQKTICADWSEINDELLAEHEQNILNRKKNKTSA